MCIAILLPPYKTIDKKALQNCNESNPDGFGYAFFNNGLYMRKYVDEKKMDEYIDKFLSLREKHLDKPFLVHFRIATHGKISTRCTHPFKISKNMVFCHNGILRQDFGVDRNSLDSDTMMFNKNILQRIDKECLNNAIRGNNQVLIDLLEGYIGSGNKMIFLNDEGNYKILNEGLGVWDKGCWFSNSSYRDKEPLTNIYNNNFYWSSSWDNDYWHTDYKSPKFAWKK